MARRRYETTSPPKERSLARALLLAAATSVALGLGLNFLLLWSGVWI